MLTKTVLCAAAGGECKLVEVPFTWQHGEPLPANAFEQRFSSAVDALSELSTRGRLHARVHIPKPERPLKQAARPGGDAATQTEEPSPDLPAAL